jgi:hypothetical protein
MLLAVNAHAPLAACRHHPGARLQLRCGACGWTRDYDPERIAERLLELKRGGPSTPVAAVAMNVQWPCPGCGRMRWKSELVGPKD